MRARERPRAVAGAARTSVKRTAPSVPSASIARAAAVTAVHLPAPGGPVTSTVRWEARARRTRADAAESGGDGAAWSPAATAASAAAALDPDASTASSSSTAVTPLGWAPETAVASAERVEADAARRAPSLSPPSACSTAARSSSQATRSWPEDATERQASARAGWRTASAAPGSAARAAASWRSSEARPTAVNRGSMRSCTLAASEDVKLAVRVQRLYASSNLRVNTSTDVIGVEMAGALKNVLAIAAGIVEGLELGNNAMAALVAQGCSEIRWLAERMGAEPVTLLGLSGVGDIMLTCFVNLSRNRTVGVRLGSGESLQAILASQKGVSEGVATAAAVVVLARKHRVSLPVLTAVARIVDGEMSPREAVETVMALPQIPEK